MARADTLMSMLPPVGWSDVVTTRDLDALEDRLNARIEALAARMDALSARLDALPSRLEAQFHREMNRQIWAMLGFLTAAGAIVTANNVF